jgi:hypothetical protein
MNQMLKLFSINILPVVIVHSLFLFFTHILKLNEYGIVSLIQIIFELMTPLLLLAVNYKLAVKKDKLYFIPNFFLILISSLLGVAFGYINWGLDAGLNDLTKRSALLDPDEETYLIEMILVKINVIGSIFGSILCSIILKLKNRKNQILG